MAAARELARYKLDLVGVQEVRWDKEGTVKAGDYSFFYGKRRVWGRIEVYTGCWWGSLRERGHWEDQDVDRRTILSWIFRKLKGVVGIGWSWLRIGTDGGHLWVR